MRNEKFTLIELLMVIAVIAILAALLLPALSKVKQSALSAQCISNEKQIFLGISMYANDYNEHLPLRQNFGDSNYAWFMHLSKVRGKQLGYYTDVKIFLCPAQDPSTHGAAFLTWPDDYGLNYVISPSYRRDKNKHPSSQYVMMDGPPTGVGIIYGFPNTYGYVPTVRHGKSINIMYLDASCRAMVMKDITNLYGDKYTTFPANGYLGKNPGNFDGSLSNRPSPWNWFVNGPPIDLQK